jgi:hypothetical protein
VQTLDEVRLWNALLPPPVPRRKSRFGAGRRGFPPRIGNRRGRVECPREVSSGHGDLGERRTTRRGSRRRDVAEDAGSLEVIRTVEGAISR